MKDISLKKGILVRISSGYRFTVPPKDRDKIKEGDWVFLVPVKFIKASELVEE